MAKHLKYSDNLDYLMASIIYLGTQSYWWARTAKQMAHELSLDEQKLRAVFTGFPGIFRESNELDKESKELMYSLQARYALKDPSRVPDRQKSIAPILDADALRLLLDFIQKSADDERTSHRVRVGNSIAVCAAIVSAIAAVIAASIKGA